MSGIRDVDMPAFRAELRAEAEREDATHVELTSGEALSLLDALDAADLPGRIVTTPDGHTFDLVCGACSRGWGCKAHGDDWPR